jgi:hypothetical protein
MRWNGIFICSMLKYVWDSKELVEEPAAGAGAGADAGARAGAEANLGRWGTSRLLGDIWAGGGHLGWWGTSRMVGDI